MHLVAGHPFFMALCAVAALLASTAVRSTTGRLRPGLHGVRRMVPSSAGDAMRRAEQLEREAHDEIPEYRLEEAVGRLREALALRQAYQGEAHPDLIWTLSLWIGALLCRHRRKTALEAACLGERRLALRRMALAGAPDELAHSLRELIDLYTFEYDVLDTNRVDELRRELATLEGAGGSGQEA